MLEIHLIFTLNFYWFIKMKHFIIASFVLFTSCVFAQTTTLKLSSDIWPPFTNVENEKALALDIVEEGLKRCNITTDLNILNFEQVMDGIMEGDFDGSGALWKNDEREKELLFSDAYLQNQLILVGLKGANVDISALSELENKKIGVVENYAYGDELKGGNNNEIIFGESDQQNLERLISKEIDYFLVDALLIQYLLKYQLNDVSALLEIGDHPLIVKPLHLAIRKDVPDVENIISQFNKAIVSMMADGSYNEILELNWVRADVDGDGKQELILAGNEAGTAEPEYSYNILYSENDQTSGGYYVDGTMYNTWNDVPNQYKVNIPEVKPPTDLDDATMKIRF